MIIFVSIIYENDDDAGDHDYADEEVFKHVYLILKNLLHYMYLMKCDDDEADYDDDDVPSHTGLARDLEFIVIG